MQPSNIVKRYDALASQRKTVEDVWEVINKLVVPFRGDFFREVSSEHAVEWRDNRQVYDSTAINACNTLASSLHGSLTSPAIRWFDVEWRDQKVNLLQPARQWIETASSIAFQTLQDSNFNLEANEGYIDLCSYGIAFIIEEVDEKNGQFEDLRFQACPIEEGQFEEDHKGQVYRFYRRYKWTAVQIIAKWGPENVPQKILQMAQAGVDDKHDVLFCIYPRDDKAKNKNARTRLAPKERPYGFKYILKEGQIELQEGGYYEMPVFTPRWRKTSKSKWGHGPAMIALPDILTLNQLVEFTLTSVEKVLDPATLITERGLLSDLDLGPAGMTVVRDVEKSIKAYESRARFDVSALEKGALQSAIRSVFYADQLELKESPAMTATEVQTRYELMQRLLGPTLGRLQSDYLDPLIQRTFNILLREGQFPDLPPELEGQDSSMDIVYTGPLVRAQRSDIALGTTRWLATAAQMSEYYPEAMDIPNMDEILRGYGTMEGVPARFMNPDNVIKKKRRDRNARERVMAMAEEVQAAGEANQAMGVVEQNGNVRPAGNAGVNAAA